MSLWARPLTPLHFTSVLRWDAAHKCNDKMHNCCNLFLLINDSNSLERADVSSAGIWTPADELVLVGGNCRWRGQNGISCSSSCTTPRWRQLSADGWLEDNRNCCRSMHAPLTALRCNCVCVWLIDSIVSEWNFRRVFLQRNPGERPLPSGLAAGPTAPRHSVNEETEIH